MDMWKSFHSVLGYGILSSEIDFEKSFQSKGNKIPIW